MKTNVTSKHMMAIRLKTTFFNFKIYFQTFRKDTNWCSIRYPSC